MLVLSTYRVSHCKTGCSSHEIKCISFHIHVTIVLILGFWFGFMGFNATFNNISVIFVSFIQKWLQISGKLEKSWILHLSVKRMKNKRKIQQSKYFHNLIEKWQKEVKIDNPNTQSVIYWIREIIQFITMYYLLDSRKNKISYCVLSIGSKKE